MIIELLFPRCNRLWICRSAEQTFGNSHLTPLFQTLSPRTPSGEGDLCTGLGEQRPAFNLSRITFLHNLMAKRGAWLPSHLVNIKLLGQEKPRRTTLWVSEGGSGPQDWEAGDVRDCSQIACRDRWAAPLPVWAFSIDGTFRRYETHKDT
jgi:hypothetical protein